MDGILRRGLAVASLLGFAKGAVGLGVVLLGEAPTQAAESLRAALVFIFILAAVLLSAGTREATKSRSLGRLMALLGAALSLRLVRGWEHESLWRAVHPEAFMAAAALDFARAFPGSKISPLLGRAVLLWGVSDFLARALLSAATFAGSLVAQSLLKGMPAWDWIPTYLLALFALFPLLRALSASEGAEQRQLRLFMRGLAIGVAPFVLILPAAALLPWFNEFLGRPEIQPYFLAFTYPLLFVFPITATYAVLYQGALDYQSALRRAAQYALARYTLLGLIAVPIATGVVLLYANRAEPLAQILSGWRFLALAGIASVAAAAFPARHRLLAALDRRHYREAYDPKRVLLQVTDAVRKARDLPELARGLTEAVDAALHVESVAIMIATADTPGRLTLAAGTSNTVIEPIAASAQFVTLLAGSPDPLAIDFANPESMIGRLPNREKDWLRTGGFALLVPLLASDAMLVGFMALCPRRSETPFSRDDSDLLMTVAAAAGAAIEARLMRATPTPGKSPGRSVHDEAPPGRECLQCGRVFEAGVASCPSCGIDTEVAALPLTPLGKYRLESRLGAGGFGVVYAASELRLSRRVALKVLPRLSHERVERFKREALAAAAFQHPNLALIHTAETWNDTPFLVFELLGGGTLAQRLLEGPLPIEEVLRLGVALAGVLEEAHRRGILHRDIKPSNIGYDGFGNPKLLDFGIARMREPATSHGSLAETITLDRPGVDAFRVPVTRDAPLTETGEIVGTPAYLPLEAYQSREPGPPFDLWALSVTLYESLTGANPFRAPTPAECIERLLRADRPSVVTMRPDCPLPLSLLLARALSRQEEDRPGSAEEYRTALASMSA